MYKNILVPLDGSENSRLALDEALTIAQKFDSKVFIVSVVDPGRVSGVMLEAPTAVGPDQLIGPMIEEAESYIKKAVSEVKNRNIPYETKVFQGSPKGMIAKDIPEEYDIDLTVMGKSGANALTRLMIGSTTAYVARYANNNVMIVSQDE